MLHKKNLGTRDMKKRESSNRCLDTACISNTVLYGLLLTIVGTAKGPGQARELR